MSWAQNAISLGLGAARGELFSIPRHKGSAPLDKTPRTIGKEIIV